MRAIAAGLRRDAMYGLTPDEQESFVDILLAIKSNLVALNGSGNIRRLDRSNRIPRTSAQGMSKGSRESPERIGRFRAAHRCFSSSYRWPRSRSESTSTRRAADTSPPRTPTSSRMSSRSAADVSGRVEWVGVDDNTLVRAGPDPVPARPAAVQRSRSTGPRRSWSLCAPRSSTCARTTARRWRKLPRRKSGSRSSPGSSARQTTAEGAQARRASRPTTWPRTISRSPGGRSGCCASACSVRWRVSAATPISRSRSTRDSCVLRAERDQAAIAYRRHVHRSAHRRNRQQHEVAGGRVRGGRPCRVQHHRAREGSGSRPI